MSDATLAAELRRLIAAEGPISVERYMGLCLSHPRLGYYTTRDPLGAAGDFTTAPEISQMFGELIGLWAAAVWQMMGAPSQVQLVELGPGRGTLMADALRAARVLPAFLDAVHVDLVEVSPVLRERQRSVLAEHARRGRVAWHARLEQVAAGPAIVIANEFIDALPIRQFVRGDRGWHERLVGLSAHGELAWGLAAEPERALASVRGAAGAVLELNPAGAATAAALAQRFVSHGGAALIIDYGHVRSASGDTLQALKGHAPVDPLTLPGLADLTAHVDFAALAQATLRAGAAVHGPVTQGAFLQALGIAARAERLGRGASEAQRDAIAAALERLVGEDGGHMGRLFKAMAIADPALAPLPGLSPQHLPTDMSETSPQEQTQGRGQGDTAT